MFCYQCEQAAKGEGCTKIGVCGKQPEVADLQDLTAYVLRGLSLVALEGRKTGNVISEADQYTVALLFSTLTNVNFDPEYFVNAIKQIVRYRDELRAMIENTGRDLQLPEGPATFEPAADGAGIIRQAQGKGLKNYPTSDPDIASLMHTVLFGLKGVAAYTDHAQILDVKDEEHY
ncbi:MAG: hydroxylamine reductase, partial [Desulfocurvibacter africanus]